MPGVLVTPTPLPANWEATAVPGAQRVIIEQVSPSAMSTPEIAILGVLIFGLGLLIILGVMQLLRRNV